MSLCPACQQPLSGTEGSCASCGRQLAPPALPDPAHPTQLPGEEVWVTVPIYTTQPALSSTDASGPSRVLPVWQYVLLQLATCGFYDFVWFYQNWKLIQERNGWNINPAARALFRVFWMRSYCHEIFTLTQSDEDKDHWSPEILSTFYILLGLFGYVAGDPNDVWGFVFSFVCFGAQIATMVPVLEALNAYWRREQPHALERTTLSAGAIIAIVLGGLFWAIALTGLFIAGG